MHLFAHLHQNLKNEAAISLAHSPSAAIRKPDALLKGGAGGEGGALRSQHCPCHGAPPPDGASPLPCGLAVGCPHRLGPLPPAMMRAIPLWHLWARRGHAPDARVLWL